MQIPSPNHWYVARTNLLVKSLTKVEFSALLPSHNDRLKAHLSFDYASKFPPPSNPGNNQLSEIRSAILNTRIRPLDSYESSEPSSLLAKGMAEHQVPLALDQPFGRQDI
jgi:hypothetical protein